MKFLGYTLFERATFAGARQASNREITPPLAVSGGVMLPEYMHMRRIAEEMQQQMEQHNGRQVRSYDAGLSTNLNMDLKGTYGAPNTEIFPFLYKVRANARTMEKDTPHGKAAMRTLADNVVGDDPFELEMELRKEDENGDLVDDDEVGGAIEDAFKRFCRKENMTVRKNMGKVEFLRVIELERATVGNVIMTLYPEYPFNEFGFAVDLLEADRLLETFVGVSGQDSMNGPGNPIRASIEYHPTYNFALSYWLLERHPGEAYAQPVPGTKYYRKQWAASKVLLWSNLRTRAEQDLGMTELDAAMQPMWRLYQYSKSLTVAAIASCIKPFVLEKKMPTGIQLPTDMDAAGFQSWYGSGGSTATGQATSGAAGKEQGATRPTQRLSPGMERELPFGVEAKILDPKFPVEAAEDFIKSCLREIAVACGVSYQHISGDFQNLGFIAGLMCQQPFQRNMRIRQESFIENLLLLFRSWLKATILKGYFEKRGVEVLMSKLEDYVDAAKFKAQPWPFVNPLVEAQTLIILREDGHITRQQTQDRLPGGMRLKKLIKILKNEYDLLAENELMYDEVDVTRPTISKGEPGATVAPGAGSGGAEPPAKSRASNPVRGKRSRVAKEILDIAMQMSVNGEH